MAIPGKIKMFFVPCSILTEPGPHLPSYSASAGQWGRAPSHGGKMALVSSSILCWDYKSVSTPPLHHMPL